MERIESLILDDPHEAIVRDLFLIGCETSLRFSDFIQIQPHQFKNDQLYIKPKKTRGTNAKQLIIPMSKRFKRILEHYNLVLPNYEHNALTRFNRTIRLTCAKANITETIVFSRLVAGKTVLINKFRYE